MQPIRYGQGYRYGSRNLRWGSPSYLLQPGDAGYLPDPSAPPPKPKAKRQYTMSNPTPRNLDDLSAAGEDLCDGLDTHAVAIGLKQNTPALARGELTALIATNDAFNAAQGEQPAAYTALRVADSNAKGFIGAAIKVLRISLGEDWSDVWLATGLPDNSLGIPTTQNARFTALSGLKAYFTANPTREFTSATVTVTAALANTLHTAFSTARNGVNAALAKTKGKLLLREPAEEAFRRRFRGTVEELGQVLSDEDPKWYDFGLNRPADPSTPGVPSNVLGTALGGRRVLVQIDFARRANSYNFYKKVVGTDAAPVKVANTQGTQLTIENLPLGTTVEITVAGVNDAGEGVPSDPVSVVVA